MAFAAPTPPADRVLRAMTDDGAFRVITVRSTDTAREAIAKQDVQGAAAIELGELITAAVLVRETMAPPYRVQILLRDRGDNTIVGDSFPEGHCRGLVRVADQALGVRMEQGGYLQVLRSLPGRSPHQGVVEVEPDGGIGQGLVSYFERSEQIETMVAVPCGLSAGEVAVAGGYVVQLLPEVTAPPLDAMRDRLAALVDLERELVACDGDPQWLLDTLLGGEPYTALAASPISFGCGCGTDKAAIAARALGADDLRGMVGSGESLRISCDYCRAVYELGPADLRRILGHLE